MSTDMCISRWASRKIEAAEVRPGNLDVVHHVIVFTTNPSALDRNGVGLGGSFGGYKESGIGCEMGSDVLDLYIETRSVCIAMGQSHVDL